MPRNNYIVDNDVVGGATWVDDQLGADGYDGGEGIQFTGSGHVVCFNHVKGFRDNISLMEYDEAYEQVSIDICNNDIEEATDDAIEADSAMGNVRVLRNRIKNCFDGMQLAAEPGRPDLLHPQRDVQRAVQRLQVPQRHGRRRRLHNTVVKCGDGFGCYAGETWSRAYCPQQHLHRRHRRRHLRRLRQRLGPRARPGRRRRDLLIRLRRPWARSAPASSKANRRHPLHQRGDHAKPTPPRCTRWPST
jgi:hypothetical protein